MPNPLTLHTYLSRYMKNKITEFICSHRFECKEDFEDFRTYIQRGLPQSIKDKLMNELLLMFCGERYEKKFMKRIVEFFLSEYTRKLIIFPFTFEIRPSTASYIEKFFSKVFYWKPSNVFDEMMKILKFHKPNLTHLELLNEDLTYSDFKSILTFTPNLTTLKVRSLEMKDHDFMGLILKECPILEELEIIFKKINFNFQIIYSWPIHENLKRLKLKKEQRKHPPLSVTNSITFLENFPNLEILNANGFFSPNLLITSKMSRNLQELSLGLYNLLPNERIYQFYPNIKTLSITDPRNGVVNFIENFKCLSDLTLLGCRESQFMPLFVNSGLQFKILRLGVGKINLSLLLNSCPNLEFLHLYLVGFVKEENGDLDDDERLSVEDVVIFYDNLKNFHFYTEFTVPKSFKKFLQGLRNVEVLSFNYLPFDDPSDLLEMNWRNVRILRIPHSPFLNMDSLINFIQNCHYLEEIVLPKHLDENQVRKFIKDNNFDINIIDHKYNKFNFLIDIYYGYF